MQLKTKDMNVRGRLFGAVIWIIGFCLLSVVHNTVYSQTITPFQYGLKDAQTPEDIYRVLLRTHQAADSCGGIVSYAGIDTLCMTIPADAQSIPLQKNNDFGGTVFIVNNGSKELFLFQYSPAAEPILVYDTLALCHAIDSGNFRNIPGLAEGDWLLRIVDSTPWVDRRRGYQYGHYREDIMILHNGISYDTTAMPYSFGGSRPTLFACRLDSVDTCPFLSGISYLCVNRPRLLLHILSSLRIFRRHHFATLSSLHRIATSLLVTMLSYIFIIPPTLASTALLFGVLIRDLTTPVTDFCWAICAIRTSVGLRLSLTGVFSVLTI